MARVDKATKVTTARTLWVPAVNGHGGFGRWVFVEVTDPWDAANTIRAALAPEGTIWKPRGDAMTPRIPIPQEQVAEFCKRWKIAEFALFGSVLGGDFRPDSDIDVLVRFAADSEWSLLDIVAMEEELKQIFGRDVDLVQREAIEESRNWIRRRHILEHHQVVYAAR